MFPKTSTTKSKGHHTPGAITPSIVHAKHSFPPHEDWGIFEKHKFANKIANIINQNSSLFEELILIAPPKTLGDVRQHLTPASLAKIIKEIDKDYTHTPIKEIEEIL
jgi:protein required for attachment to host cells